MKNYLLVLCCWLAMTVSAQTTIEPNLKWGKPTDEEMTMAVYDADKDAAAVVLCQLTTVDYTMDLNNYMVNYNVKTRIKVLKDEGKDVANISITYMDNRKRQYAQENIDEFKATAYNLENGKVRKTKIGQDKLFKERVDEDYVVAKAAIPQVKAGTVIEYEYVLRSNVFYRIHDWEAQKDIPVAYTNYRLEIPARLMFNVETSGIFPLQSTVTQGTLVYQTSSDAMARKGKCPTNIYNCTGRNFPALKKDDYVWNIRDYYTKVTAELQRLNYSDGTYEDMRKNWEQVDDVLYDHPDFGERLYKHSKYREELLASGISEIVDLKDKVAATFNFLRQRLVWNGEYELAIKSQSDIVKNGSGTNADLNMMLINMLSDVGVKAYPAVMSTRRHGRIPKTYPTLNKLNTFIVAVPYGSSWIYVDASSADGYLNVLPANLYTDQARILQKGAASQWVNLQKIGEARTQLTIKASLTADGVLKGEQTAVYTGNAAAQERIRFRQATDSTAFITSKATQEGLTITSCNIDGIHDFSPTVTEVTQFTKQGTIADAHIYINPFTELPVTSNPFSDKERMLPVEFPYRSAYSINVQLELPEGWQLEELPQSVRASALKSASGHIIYSSADKRNVTINYQFRISNVYCDNTQYDALRQLFDLFANHAKDMLVVKKL